MTGMARNAGLALMRVLPHSRQSQAGWNVHQDQFGRSLAAAASPSSPFSAG